MTYNSPRRRPDPIQRPLSPNTIPGGLAKTHTARRITARRLGIAASVLLALCALLALFELGDRVMLAGLQVGRLTGTPPPNAPLIQSLVDKLTSNWLWLVATGVGLIAALAAGMMAFGSQRAPDVLFCVVAGIGIILIVIPSALA